MTPGTGPRLQLIDVSKVYRGGHWAVEALTLDLDSGLLGLLGPNGAGKSTLMSVAATVTRPTSGRVLFEGLDVVSKPDALRRRLGYLPQDFGVYPNLTVREFLGYLAAAKGLSARSARAQMDELIPMVNLSAAVKRPIGSYSGGMLRRVGIAQALLGDPQVVIVDEPTAGLDPEERVRFRNMLSRLAADRVVMLSTHIVSDVESVADDIAVMARGRLLWRGTPAQLRARAWGVVWEVTVASREVEAVQARHQVSRMMRTAEGVRLRLVSAEQPLQGAVQIAADLEDAYLCVLEQNAGWSNRGAGSPAPTGGG